jgi:hypothetical protein
MEAKNLSFEGLRSLTGPFDEHFYNYIKLVGEGNIRDLLEEQAQKTIEFFTSIGREKWLYKYAEGKWTLKEVLQHITDAERVFAYRALAFARKDSNSLPSFDENSYAANSNANSREWADLIEEFAAVRKSTILLFNSFSDETLRNTGIASGKEISVLALGYISVGHLSHHVNIISEKYLGS